MRALIVIAAVVVLLALVIMFVFTSHQDTLHNEAQNQATEQSAKDASSAASKSTLGPIKVNKSSLYNRTNDALGESGSGPKSVIAGTTPGSLPATSTSGQ